MYSVSKTSQQSISTTNMVVITLTLTLPTARTNAVFLEKENDTVIISSASVNALVELHKIDIDLVSRQIDAFQLNACHILRRRCRTQYRCESKPFLCSADITYCRPSLIFKLASNNCYL